jgi:hypothetical protein
MIDQGTTTVFRGDGTSWAPALTAPANEFFYALWGSSPDDVWLGGSRLRHWNGADWSDLTPPELLLDPSREVRTLAGRTPEDVWLGATIPASSSPARLFHWDGSSWTERTPPESVTGGPAHVSDIWVSPSRDAWATAIWQVNGAAWWGGVLRWSGASWQSAVAGNLSENNWQSIWGSADDDLWVVGQMGMAHFDGVSWRPDRTATGITRIGAPTLWGSCARDVWAIGLNEQVWHFDGVSWSQVVFDPLSRVALRTVTGTGPDDVWFGGSLIDSVGVSWHHQPDLAPACGNLRVDPGEDCDPPDGKTCDATCHTACTASGAACTSGGVGCCNGFRCITGTCQCVPTGTSCTAGDQCCQGSCMNGQCNSCRQLDVQCDASNPCCSGLVCSANGLCVKPQPSCMPDGALCSATSPCCSGAACVDGLCGGACVLDGAPCDGSHPCCQASSTCTNGVCGGVACVPLGQSCGGPGGCCAGNLCGGAGLCRSQGGSCADVGINCNVVSNGCCSGSTCGPAGTCIVAVGCYPPGQDCGDGPTNSTQCCSGICRRSNARGTCL